MTFNPEGVTQAEVPGNFVGSPREQSTCSLIECSLGELQQSLNALKQHEQKYCKKKIPLAYDRSTNLLARGMRKIWLSAI